MEPTLNPQAFVFCTSQSLTLEQAAALNPQGLFWETEG
ncbi:MAG: ribonuclease H, partial [Enterobacterales bacterium]|nr:ribonuclease H [Enterobacterales bacterium]